MADVLAQAAQREACGFLLGVKSSLDQVVTDIALVRSPAPALGVFEISDGEIRRVRAWAADRHLDILAIVHSHPSGNPCLSEADRAALRYSEWPWIVVTPPTDQGAVTLTGYLAGSGARLEIRVIAS